LQAKILARNLGIRVRCSRCSRRCSSRSCGSSCGNHRWLIEQPRRWRLWPRRRLIFFFFFFPFFSLWNSLELHKIYPNPVHLCSYQPMNNDWQFWCSAILLILLVFSSKMVEQNLIRGHRKKSVLLSDAELLEVRGKLLCSLLVVQPYLAYFSIVIAN
jgi:hypothetical protein